MANCAEVINGSYFISQNPPQDISTCSAIIFDGLEYAQLQQIMLIAQNPVDYTQAASIFTAVFTLTIIFWANCFAGAQFLGLAKLGRKV